VHGGGVRGVRREGHGDVALDVGLAQVRPHVVRERRVLRDVEGRVDGTEAPQRVAPPLAARVDAREVAPPEGLHEGAVVLRPGVVAGGVEEVVTLWSGELGEGAPFAPPDVDEAGIVWVEPGPGPGAWSLRAWDLGGEPRSLGEWDQPIRRVVRAEDHLVWIDPRGVWRRPVDGGVADLLTPGDCGALDADGPRVVYLCEGEGELPAGTELTSPAFPAAQGSLWLHDGATLTAVPTEGALTVRPRVSEELLAWVTFPQPTDGCFDHGPGTVWAAGVDDPGAALALGEIGVGCYCCAMIWPELQLDVADRIVAWNYAGFAGPPLNDRDFGRVGFAELFPAYTCD